MKSRYSKNSHNVGIITFAHENTSSALTGSVVWSVIPYTKRLQVRCPVRVCMVDNQSFPLTLMSDCLSLSLPFSHSKINKNISSSDDNKKKEKTLVA